MLVMGVDLRASIRRPSSVVALDSLPSVTLLNSFSSNNELLEIAGTVCPDLIAIGAPLNLPSGFCCLDQSCDCQFAVPDRKGRLLELELARMGISCFYTNKGSIIRDLIYRGIKLNALLKSAGYNVIEVYPHATKMVLFGDNVPSKNSAGGVDYMVAHLSQLISGLSDHPKTLDKNDCDAVINAYTGLLHGRAATDTLGDPEEGVVVLPKLAS